jgi:hypothetical protein
LSALFVNTEQAQDAIPLLEAAIKSWEEQSNAWDQNKSEAILGLALLKLGESNRAGKLALKGWQVFQAGMPLGEHPQKWLWSLYRLLIGLNQTENALKVLSATFEELQRQAKNISDTKQRHNFFEKVPENFAIVKAYDQLISKTANVVSVSLARKDVPLGRTLRADEYVTVQWTVSAIEDDAIVDKTERRLSRLRRLLSEAEAQQASPTDEALAQALGVSRRTILRDMKTLNQEIKLVTRKRKY